MRLSAAENDKGYHPQAYLCTVYLDGQKLSNCITADEEKGECVCHIVGESGNCVLDENGELAIEIRQGIVKIGIPKNFDKELFKCYQNAQNR